MCLDLCRKACIPRIGGEKTGTTAWVTARRECFLKQHSLASPYRRLYLCLFRKRCIMSDYHHATIITYTILPPSTSTTTYPLESPIIYNLPIIRNFFQHQHTFHLGAFVETLKLNSVSHDRLSHHHRCLSHGAFWISFLALPLHHDLC